MPTVIPQGNSLDDLALRYYRETEERNRLQIAQSPLVYQPGQVVPQPHSLVNYYSEVTQSQEAALNQSLNAIWYTSPAINFRSGISTAGFGESTTSPTIAETPRWPINTIVKWNIHKLGVVEYLRSRGIPLNQAFVKIVSYLSSGDIKEAIGFGECEPCAINLPAHFFTDATPDECEEYSRAYANLRICQTRPNIGQVVKYVGNGERKGKQGVVRSHCREDGIVVTWKRQGEMSTYKFNLFQLTKRQEGAFTPVESEYCACANCRSLRHISNRRMVGNVTFCDNLCATVAGNDYCRACGVWHPLPTFIETRNGYVCNSCHTAHYRQCRECGIENRVNQMRLEITGDYTCVSCIGDNVIIHEYHYKPTPIYNKMIWENTRYLGIELEVETSNSAARESLARKIPVYLKQISDPKGKKLDKLVYIKRDGSLSSGIEIVFHPFTLQALHKYFPVRDFLTFLKDNGAVVKDNCGMHVHVSKEKVGNDKLLNGKWFFYKCAKYIQKFSERSSFNFCNFPVYAPAPDPYNQPHGRHTAFNVAASTKTIEVRVCRSTLDYIKFESNLQFADCFMGYIQRPGKAFLRTGKPEQIWDDFYKYAKKHGQYHILADYLKEEGIV